MARKLSQTLLKFPSFPSSQTTLFPKFSFNPKNLSTKAQLIEVDLESSSSSSEGEVVGLRRLEDAIHSIFVRRLAPDWLPFRPGSSYWVPPKQRSDNIVELVEKLTNPMTEEETLSLSSDRGFPSSNFYLGGPVSPVEVEVQVHVLSNSREPSLSEDED